MKNLIPQKTQQISAGVAAIALTISLNSCGKSPAKNASADSGSDVKQRIFSAQGMIKQINWEDHEVVIQHGDITNYMPAMTMPFPVKDTNELNGLKIGEAISFHLVVSPDNEWIEKLTPIVVASAASQTNRINFIPFVENLKMGDLLPSYPFINSAGTNVNLIDFKGQALAIGFVLPTENQPELVTIFSRIQQLLKQGKTSPQNWQLLCVALDARQEVGNLANFGKDVSADTSHWQFLTSDAATLSQFADQCGVVVWPQTNGIYYNSRIVVVNANGKIQNIFKGKDWTDASLANELIKATTIP